MTIMTGSEWPNESYERDVLETLLWNRWVLKFLGVWPYVYSRVSKSEKRLSRFSLVVCWFALFFLLIPTLIYVLVIETNLRKRVRMFGPVTYVLSSILKYAFLFLGCKDIRRCVEIIEIDWRSVREDVYRQIMIKHIAQCRILSKISFGFAYTAAFCYHVVRPCLSRNLWKNKSVMSIQRAYPSFDTILGIHHVPTFVCTMLIHYYCAVVMYNISGSISCLAFTFVTHACGQIEIVMSRLENIVKDEKNSKIRSGCKNYCVAMALEHHVRILKFARSINQVFQKICIVEVLGSTLIICTLEYYCIVEWSNLNGTGILTYLSLLLSFIFNLFMLCYIGDALTHQCAKVGRSFYAIEWYDPSTKVAIEIILFILVSHRPVKITAGKVIDMTLITFVNVLKTSVAYLNILRNFIR